MQKIQADGIQRKVYKWIKQWLTNRYQRVCQYVVASQRKNVSNGVVQGSVICPTLFLIYINDMDMDNEISNGLLKFADETKLFGSSKKLPKMPPLTALGRSLVARRFAYRTKIGCLQMKER